MIIQIPYDFFLSLNYCLIIGWSTSHKFLFFLLTSSFDAAKSWLHNKIESGEGECVNLANHGFWGSKAI